MVAVTRARKESAGLKNMKTIPIQELVSIISDGIYHATSIERYRDIIDNGYILPGNRVTHKNFPQSEVSNCHELSAIACFDFGRADASKVFGDDAMMKWPGVLLSYRYSDYPTTILIGFVRSLLPKEPLYYAEIKKQLGFGGIIPYGIECCYPGQLSLNLASNIIAACHWNQIVLELVSLKNTVITNNMIEQIGSRHIELAEQYRLTLRDGKTYEA